MIAAQTSSDKNLPHRRDSEDSSLYELSRAIAGGSTSRHADFRNDNSNTASDTIVPSTADRDADPDVVEAAQILTAMAGRSTSQHTGSAHEKENTASDTIAPNMADAAELRSLADEQLREQDRSETM